MHVFGFSHTKLFDQEGLCKNKKYNEIIYLLKKDKNKNIIKRNKCNFECNKRVWFDTKKIIIWSVWHFLRWYSLIWKTWYMKLYGFSIPTTAMCLWNSLIRWNINATTVLLSNIFSNKWKMNFSSAEDCSALRTKSLFPLAISWVFVP